MYYNYRFHAGLDKMENLFEVFEHLSDLPLACKFVSTDKGFVYKQPLVGVNPETVTVVVKDKVLTVKRSDNAQVRLMVPEELEISSLKWNLEYGELTISGDRRQSPPDFTVPRR